MKKVFISVWLLGLCNYLIESMWVMLENLFCKCMLIIDFGNGFFRYVFGRIINIFNKGVRKKI